MQKAKIVREVFQERGRKSLQINRIYRQLYNTDHYLTAYAKIYSNKGATTAGATSETVNGMSTRKIDKIIKDLTNERFQWTPTKRVLIPKKNGQKRPLGLPTWTDKLLQEVIRSLLEAYYEPQFSESSHGFRPGRGCHTALTEIRKCWRGTKWFIEGDIKGCFDNINHEILLKIIAEKIHDTRFIKILRRLLKAGYLEDWKFGKTFSGTPQGGILSPLLANIYLHELDQFIEKELIPKYTKGDRRQRNPNYESIRRKKKRTKDPNLRKQLTNQLRKTPSADPNDPNYRRLRYIRYADDFLLGFIGSRAEAEEIKREIKTFLAQRLKMELSESKTLITHARNDKARFLEYEIRTMHDNNRLDKNKRRSVNGTIWLRIPNEVINAKCRQYMKNGKVIHRPQTTRESDYHIISTYQTEFRGIVQFYKLAHNIRELGKLRWIMNRSLTATLANKFRTTRAKIRQKYETNYKHPNGYTYRVLKTTIKRENRKDLETHWGAIPLTRDPNAIIIDKPRIIWTNKRSELLQRLLANKCEICGSTRDIEVHHVRALKDLKKKGRKNPKWWETLMATRKRKTLVTCRKCHNKIHKGIDPRMKNRTTGEPDEGKPSRPVRCDTKLSD